MGRATYEAGLQRIARVQHDVGLVDYRLAERDGLEFLREVVVLGCNTPNVLLTGEADREIDLRAMQVGAADYLVKGQIASDLLERSIRYALIERQRLLAELRNLSLIDGPTGSHNRLLTVSSPLANQHLLLARRMLTGALLVFIDVDGLKQINDTFGHLEGDTDWVEVADILKRTFRDSAIPARWGGDEFTVLATHVSSRSDDKLLARLRESLVEHN